MVDNEGEIKGHSINLQWLSWIHENQLVIALQDVNFTKMTNELLILFVLLIQKIGYWHEIVNPFHILFLYNSNEPTSRFSMILGLR